MVSIKLFVFLSVSFLLFGCVYQSNLESYPIDSNKSTTTAASTPAIIDIAIKDFNFSKNDLVVKKGTTLRWTNFDSTEHSVTSYGLFDSKLLAPGKSFSFTFEKTGEYYYLCILHPGMIGKVKVE